MFLGESNTLLEHLVLLTSDLRKNIDETVGSQTHCDHPFLENEEVELGQEDDVFLKRLEKVRDQLSIIIFNNYCG